MIEKIDIEDDIAPHEAPMGGAAGPQPSPEDMMLKKIMTSKNLAIDGPEATQAEDFVPAYQSKSQIIDPDLEYQKLSTLNANIKNDNFSYRDKVLLVYH